MTSRSSEVRRARPLLGTFVEIAAGGLPEGEAHRAIEAAFAVVEEVQRRMSFHDPESMLSRLNREAARRAVQVDAWTFRVLAAAAEVHRVSEGVFDVTVAPHLQALGFLPGDAPAAAGAPFASFADVQLLPDRHVRFRRAGVCLDLGGIAKGFAVDRAVAALRRAGVPRGLVNAGGDLRVFGGEQRVAIRHPELPQAAHRSLPLRNAALATSAHYFAERWQPGQTLAPIIDPHTGQRVTQVLSATVRARQAMLADALTKVVMLRGEAALATLQHFSADAIFFTTSGEERCSPRWHAALELSS
ncbi:MAG: FAD:protein FMN transferase [Chthoniobacter sp.]|uniref:FAD:protein FMN transferase n=1 Tax=Chthoniobacter sp. TaxID=2510640 RepID=UPI0032A4F3B5